MKHCVEMVTKKIQKPAGCREAVKHKGGSHSKVTNQYWVWPPNASRSAVHLLRMDITILSSMVACGMLSHSS